MRFLSSKNVKMRLLTAVLPALYYSWICGGNGGTGRKKGNGRNEKGEMRERTGGKRSDSPSKNSGYGLGSNKRRR